MAKAFRRALPPEAIVWVVDSSYQPFWYYLEPNVRYAPTLGKVPADGRFALIPSRGVGDLRRDPRWGEAVPLVAAMDGQRRSFSLVERGQSGGRAASVGP